MMCVQQIQTENVGVFTYINQDDFKYRIWLTDLTHGLTRNK